MSHFRRHKYQDDSDLMVAVTRGPHHHLQTMARAFIYLLICLAGCSLTQLSIAYSPSRSKTTVQSIFHQSGQSPHLRWRSPLAKLPRHSFSSPGTYIIQAEQDTLPTPPLEIVVTFSTGETLFEAKSFNRPNLNVDIFAKFDFPKGDLDRKSVV